MAYYSRLIAERMAEGQEFSHTFVEQVASFYRLHGIGIPNAVLLKQCSLSPEELLVMDSLVELGFTMIEKELNPHALVDKSGSQVLRNLIGHHLERLDGSWYPKGLRGYAIQSRLASQRWPMC